MPVATFFHEKHGLLPLGKSQQQQVPNTGGNDRWGAVGGDGGERGRGKERESIDKAQFT